MTNKKYNIKNYQPHRTHGRDWYIFLTCDVLDVYMVNVGKYIYITYIDSMLSTWKTSPPPPPTKKNMERLSGGRLFRLKKVLQKSSTASRPL